MSSRRVLLLAVLVTGLLMGLVGMHHVAVGSEGPAPVGSHMADGPLDEPAAPHDGDAHDGGLLHLCLAILAAVAVLVASTAVWRLPTSPAAARRACVSRLRTTPRAPPPTAPARLALLCVLRT